MWIASLFLFLFGGGLNALVIHANSGMPVPITAEGFYVIYPKYYWVALKMTPDRMLIAGKAPGYTIMTEDSRLSLLADRFYVVTPINIWESLPVWLKIRFIRSNIPVIGQEMQASIGDLIIWVGDALIFLAALATIVFVLFEGLSQNLRKICGKNF